MPDTAPDWAVAEPETPDWVGSTGEMPDWAQPVISHGARLEPAATANAPGGFNYGGKPTKHTPSTALGEDFWSDLYTDASRPAVALPKFDISPDEGRTTAVAKSLANLVISLPEFVESPLGVASVATGAVLPRTVAGAFLAQTGKQINDQAKQAGAEWDTYTPAQKAAALTDIGGQTVFAGLMTHGAGGKLADAIDTRVNPAGRLARELSRTEPAFNGETPPTPLVQPFARAEAPAAVTVPDWATTEPVQTAGTPAAKAEVRMPNAEAPPPAALNPLPSALPEESPAASVAGTNPTENVPAAPLPPAGPPEQSTSVEATIPEPPTKLIPVDVSASDIASFARDTGERPPDVLDDVREVTDKPVMFHVEQFGTVVDDARAPTLRKGRATAATQRLDKMISSKEGEPVDKVLKGMAEANPKYADWTGDDLANALVGSHSAREAGRGTTTEARLLAEQQARDALFAKANRASRPGAASVPIEQLQLGDTFKLNGYDGSVTGFPVDADAGKPFGVEIETPYGKQTIPVGQALHPDEGTLKPAASDLNSGALGNMGMGAAKPGEFTNSPQTHTGIKNATVDRERTLRGLPPAVEPARRSFGDVWDHAMALLDLQPERTDKLLNELRAKPRALTDTEDALLLQRQIELQNDYGKTTRELAQAYDDGKQFPNRLADAAELKLRAAELSDKLLDLYDINKTVGTETGRGLAARKMMAYEDYTLASMELQMRAAKGGETLSATELAEVTKLQERIAKTEKDFQDYRQKAEDELAKRRVQDEIDERIKMVEKTPGYDRQVQSIADRIVSALEKEAVAARARLKARFSGLPPADGTMAMHSGPDVSIVADLATVGAAHIARGALDFTRWSKSMVKEFGEDVVPWLNTVWEKSNARVNTAVDRLAKGKQSIAVKAKVRKEDTTGQRAQVITGLQKAKADNVSDALQGDYVRKLAETFVRDGIRQREPLIDAVHKVLTEEVGLNLTRRDTMDAISGYGRFKALNPDEIKATLRDLKGQMQQVAKLDDIQSKQPLQKTGVQRRVVSDEERRLIQQVNEAKRRFGVVVTDPASQLRSALDAVRTRLQHQIADLEYQLATKARIVKTKTPAPFDAETKLLEVRRDELAKQLDDLLPKPGITDAQRLDLATKAVERSIADYERRIAAGDVAVKAGKPGITSPQLEALKARRDQLRAEFEELRDGPGKTPEQRALASLKTRLANSTAQWQERAARGDFAPRARRTITLDAEASRLKAANLAAKQEFQRALITKRLAERPGWQRGLDAFVRWRRGFLLSSPVTLGKLTSAAIQRMIFTPIEEATGAAWSAVLPKLAAAAPREGGASVRIEAKAITAAFTKGLADSAQVLKTGRGEKDVLYGGRKDQALAEHDVVPPSVIDFFGHLHGALKAPVKAAEFTRSFEKRVAWNLRRGVDVSNPLVQTRIAVEAYADANRSIFLQDNRIVSAYKRALSAFEHQPTIGGKLAATTARTLLPIVRVPTNIVAETFQYALGLPSGLARLGLALRGDIAKLPPAEADLILRHLKKGSLGAAVLTTGFLLPKVVGGYYQPGEKRRPTDVKPGTLKIGDWNVPSWALHNPLLETLQLGATVRRVADSKLRKRDFQGQGIPAGLLAGALGLTEAVPFVREQIEFSKLFEPRERGQFLGELTKSIAVPQLVAWLAQHQDTDAQGNPIKRKPEGVIQNIESGIPWLRQNVPVQAPRR